MSKLWLHFVANGFVQQPDHRLAFIQKILNEALRFSQFHRRFESVERLRQIPASQVEYGAQDLNRDNPALLAAGLRKLKQPIKRLFRSRQISLGDVQLSLREIQTAMMRKGDFFVHLGIQHSQFVLRFGQSALLNQELGFQLRSIGLTCWRGRSICLGQELRPGGESLQPPEDRVWPDTREP